MQRDFAFIQVAPGRLFVGWGPFEQLPFRRPGHPAFFIADFFLDDPHPWRHPASWEEIDLRDFSRRVSAAGEEIKVDWSEPSFEQWAELFTQAHDAISRGEFKKVVPVIFESGALTGEPLRLLDRLQRVPAGMWAYGYSYQSHGLVGLTPEILFETSARGYRTMALAGTRPIEKSQDLLSDAKELREHRMVVDDVVRRLAPFGNVSVDPLRVLKLPTIAHLMTSIRFEESRPERMSFIEMIRRLHPTAALGAWPRNDAGERWLRQADRGVKRRTFGAPFGLEREDGRALALVAIRNIQWSSKTLRLGSGAGIIAESVLEREFEELRQKREQVKGLFGIGTARGTIAAARASHDQSS